MTRLSRVALLLAALAAGVPGPAQAVLRADELGIVVRAGDPVSEAIADHYRKVRGIPAENIVRIDVPMWGEWIPQDVFQRLHADLEKRLPARVQATLLTWMEPSRVAGPCTMSVTSAFALGYDERRCSVGDRRGALPSPYFDAPAGVRPWDDLRVRPSMMLGVGTLAEAKVLIDRGRRADGTNPRGDAYLVRTTDNIRSIRWPDFQRAAAQDVSAVRVQLVDNQRGTRASDAVTGKRDVLVYFTGLGRTPGLATNTYLPGAVGDSLTSAAGVLTPGNPQTSVTEWLAAGFTASYGTVEEPFAIAPKFPQASVFLRHYTAGETLIEAYWKSVRFPGQGLFVGEPLARPFGASPARPRAAP